MSDFVTFARFGVEFRVSQDVLMALTLCHLVGKDMRTAERLADDFLPDLLQAAQRCFRVRLAQGEGGLAVHLDVDADLSVRLRQGLEQEHTQTILVTQNPALVDLFRRLGPFDDSTFRTVRSIGEASARKGACLVMVDALELSIAAPAPDLSTLDAQVVALLVPMHLGDSRVLRHYGELVPIRVEGKSFPNRQGAAETALAKALDRARFTGLFQRLQRSHLRWTSHWEFEDRLDQGTIRAKLVYDGEERIMASTDLRLNVRWAEVPSTRFKDVLGLETPKARLREALDWLQDPQGEPGIRAFVVDGPPGTGKTHLCTAMAGEAQVPCFVMGASEFMNQWWGETERIIRDTFAALAQYDAAVIVIDEFDAIAWRRDRTNDKTASYHASIMAALLRSLDLLRQGPGRVILAATTNQYDAIDPALVRSLRMGERIHIGLPDAKDRRQMLVGLLGDAMDPVDLDEIVAMTTGMSPADLAQLVGKVPRPGDHSKITLDSLRRAIFEARRGPANDGTHLDEATKMRVAVHEAGHALVAFHLLGPGSIEHLSVIPSATGSLGAAYLRPPEAAELLGRLTVEGHLAVLLAGRSAETLVYPDLGPTCGILSDLHQATLLAQSAVGAWGLDNVFPLLAWDALPEGVQQAMAGPFLDRVQAWIHVAEMRARKELGTHEAALRLLAGRLATQETLHRPDILSILVDT